ncbi:ethanolamine ammonia-lyase small subunit [Streptacidiphilus sp. MAP12-16]|uniref:ethanolamine ammonia-lyase subunit EutC n=1 Tax=Streptacidiphilus sp. MAP12-16 TaxID=3156300 RepID=UPI00351452E9
MTELHRPLQEPATRAWVRATTPARVFTGRAGTSYPTAALLALRADHAAARDAVTAPLDLDDPELDELSARFSFVTARTRAGTRAQYLRRPDLGRRLDPACREDLLAHCPAGADLQIVIGDGLSATAVHAQIPHLLPLLARGCDERGWSTGRPIVVHQCRVGVMNDVGELLDPAVVVLLIGERPGLATAESLSAYLAYRPRPGHTEADRNLLSNIHREGVPPEQAALRILALAQAMRAAGRSGVAIKEPAALES